MNCPSCGRKNLEDAKFCSECGTKFEEILKCMDCNTELDTNDSFCYACGKPIEDSSEPEIRGTLAKQESFQESVKKSKNNTSSKPYEIRGTLAKQENFQEAARASIKEPYTPPPNRTKLHRFISALLSVLLACPAAFIAAFFSAGLTVKIGYGIGFGSDFSAVGVPVMFVTFIGVLYYCSLNFQKLAEWIIKGFVILWKSLRQVK